MSGINSIAWGKQFMQGYSPHTNDDTQIKKGTWASKTQESHNVPSTFIACKKPTNSHVIVHPFYYFSLTMRIIPSYTIPALLFDSYRNKFLLSSVLLGKGYSMNKSNALFSRKLYVWNESDGEESKEKNYVNEETSHSPWRLHIIFI